jgi:hypothetical protein
MAPCSAMSTATATSSRLAPSRTRWRAPKSHQRLAGDAGAARLVPRRRRQHAGRALDRHARGHQGPGGRGQAGADAARPGALFADEDDAAAGHQRPVDRLCRQGMERAIAPGRAAAHAEEGRPDGSVDRDHAGESESAGDAGQVRINSRIRGLPAGCRRVLGGPGKGNRRVWFQVYRGHAGRWRWAGVGGLDRASPGTLTGKKTS